MPSPSGPTFQLQEFEHSKAVVNECIEALKRDGAVIIRNVLDQDILEQIKKDIRPAFDRDVPYSNSNAFPKETRRANGLIGKSEAFSNRILGNQLYQAICNHLLTCSHQLTWGDQKRVKTTKPILDATTCFLVGPGSNDQPLHRDDSLHHNVLPEITAEGYRSGRDEIVAFFVAGTNTTKANGATRVIPGSHLWGMETMPSEADAVHAELCAGDGLIMLGSCFHGGSANTTKEESRLVLGVFMTKGINRTVRTSLSIMIRVNRNKMS